MNFVEVFFIAVGLAMDAFAVSVSNGIVLKEINRKNAFVFGAFFGVFQFAMPLIGWVCAKNFKDAIESFDHWIAFVLLVLIGGKMFLETFKKDNEHNNINKDSEILSISNMTILAIATSIDALAVGVSFAFISQQDSLNIWKASIIIGIVAFAFSYIGVMLGRKVGKLLQKNAERIGGVILIGIGFKILIEHLA